MHQVLLMYRMSGARLCGIVPDQVKFTWTFLGSISSQTKYSHFNSFSHETRNAWISVSRAPQASPKEPLTFPVKSEVICLHSVFSGNICERSPLQSFSQYTLFKWKMNETMTNFQETEWNTWNKHCFAVQIRGEEPDGWHVCTCRPDGERAGIFGKQNSQSVWNWDGGGTAGTADKSGRTRPTEKESQDQSAKWCLNKTRYLKVHIT